MRSSVLVTLPVLAFATYGKDDGLARCDSHDSREDSLVECRRAFFLEHADGDLCESGKSSLPRLLGRLLDTAVKGHRLSQKKDEGITSNLRFDGIDRCIREWSHGSRNETKNHCLP